MKVGVIDLGSNTSKLLIAQKKPFPNHQNFKTLKEKSLPCRIFSLTEKKVLKIYLKQIRKLKQRVRVDIGEEYF